MGSDMFWHEVAQAHDKVSADNSLEYTIARSGLEAKVKAVAFTEGEAAAVVIIITPKDTDTPQPFIVPKGD